MALQHLTCGDARHVGTWQPSLSANCHREHAFRKREGDGAASYGRSLTYSFGSAVRKPLTIGLSCAQLCFSIFVTRLRELIAALLATSNLNGPVSPFCRQNPDDGHQ